MLTVVKGRRKAGLLLWLKLGCWLLLLLGGAGLGRAQLLDPSSDYALESWQTEAGLPHNAVTALLQTRDGYLWVGTSNGLARFDGVRFTTFRVLDNAGLKSNRILCLYQDQRGVLWVGTEEGGLARFDNGRFTSMTVADGLAADTVLSIGENSNGELWVGTSAGLCRWVGGDIGDLFRTEGLVEDAVYAICQPLNGAMLLGTGRGLFQFRQERLVPYLESGSALLGKTSLYCLRQDQDGWLWAGGQGGLRCLEPAGATNPVASLKLARAKVLVLAQGEAQHLWCGTSSGDVWGELQPGRNSSEPKLLWHFQGPITALCQDREGNLWVGTAGRGLNRLKRRPLRWSPYVEGLSEGRVACLFENSLGQLGLVGADNGLYQWEQGRFELQARLGLPVGIAVQTACSTRTNQLWFGTLNDGLFEQRNHSLRQLGERDGLSDSAIGVLCADGQAGLWIGTRNGGLNYLLQGKVTRFHTPWGLTGNFACALTTDSGGSLWIGTTGDGLFHLKQGRFECFGETNGLPDGYVRALLADEGGVLWVGTAKGLCRLKAGQLSVFTGKNGLTEEAVLQLRSDAHGYLWLGCSSGIYRLSKAQLHRFAEGPGGFLDVLPYGKEDGLPANQCVAQVQSRSWQSRAGDVWFATSKGLVLRQDKGPPWNSVPPPVVLETVLVENQSVPLAETLHMAPGKENVQFLFTALSLTAPGKVVFRYQLEGFDRDWSEVSTSRSARYPKVPPGHYRFHVVARNNDGVWNQTGASIALVVHPFWWGTAWFQLGLGALALGLFGGLYRMRLTRQREIERLRVRIASDLHDDIGSSLWSITLLSRMLSRHGTLGSEEQQDVNEINRISVQASNSIRDIIWLINPAFDTLQELMMRMKDFAATMLRGSEYIWRCEGIDLTRKLPLDFRQHLFFLIKEALTNVAKHAQASRVEVLLDEQTSLWRLTIRDNGLGFEPAAQHPGNGLKNLRVRARKLGATLELESRPGLGTTLVLTMPRP